MIRWLAEYEEDGAVWFRIGRDGDELIADWIDVVRLVARRDGSAHRIEPHVDADPREVEKVVNGAVPLLLRHLAGQTGFHGSSIVDGGKAVVFLGRARQGKSTLAAALCSRPEVALLSDDMVAIDPVREGLYRVSALERAHWLDADARRAIVASGSGEEAAEDDGKRPVPAARVAKDGELAAFVDLAFSSGAPRMVRLSPLEAFGALVPQVIRFVLDEPEVNRREIDMLTRLVEAVPTYRLERPRDLGLLSTTCDLVLDLIRGDPRPNE